MKYLELHQYVNNKRYVMKDLKVLIERNEGVERVVRLFKKQKRSGPKISKKPKIISAKVVLQMQQKYSNLKKETDSYLVCDKVKSQKVVSPVASQRPERQERSNLFSPPPQSSVTLSSTRPDVVHFNVFDNHFPTASNKSVTLPSTRPDVVHFNVFDNHFPTASNKSVTLPNADLAVPCSAKHLFPTVSNRSETFPDPNANKDVAVSRSSGRQLPQNPVVETSNSNGNKSNTVSTPFMPEKSVVSMKESNRGAYSKSVDNESKPTVDENHLRRKQRDLARESALIHLLIKQLEKADEKAKIAEQKKNSQPVQPDQQKVQSLKDIKPAVPFQTTQALHLPFSPQPTQEASFSLSSQNLQAPSVAVSSQHLQTTPLSSSRENRVPDQLAQSGKSTDSSPIVVKVESVGYTDDLLKTEFECDRCKKRFQSYMHFKEHARQYFPIELRDTACYNFFTVVQSLK